MRLQAGRARLACVPTVKGARTWRRHGRRSTNGVSMVEFALVAPLFVLLVLGIVVAGIVVMNVIGLNNGLRDAVRAAAVCGSQTDVSGTNATLPDGTTPCTSANLLTYVTTQLNNLHGGATSGSVLITLEDPTKLTGGVPTPEGTGFAALKNNCVAGKYLVKIHAAYTQPLYLPLVGVFLGNNGSSTSRQLDGTAEATCER